MKEQIVFESTVQRVCSDIREHIADKIDKVLADVLGYEPANEITWDDDYDMGMLVCCDKVPLILFFPVLAEQRGETINVTQDYHIYLENFARVSWTR